MKKIIQTVGIAAAVLISMTACGGTAQQLAAPAEATPLSYTEAGTPEREEILSAAETFAETFAPAVCAGRRGENVALSPVSVYSALSLAAICAGGETQTELLSALGMSLDALKVDFPVFYRGLNAEYRSNANSLSGKLTLGNSIWVQSGLPVKQNCLDVLSEKFFCYSYAADFAGDNGGANKSVRNFVKEQTNGIIDRDFKLGENTLFALISSLYLKDVWNEYGREIPLTPEPYSFTQGDGSETSLSLMQGYYEQGRVFDGGSFTSFYAETRHGYRLQFMVPKAGVAAEEIFTRDNLAALKDADYRPDDEENKIHYNTRCLFPAFEAGFDGDVKEILRGMGVERLFRNPDLEEDGCSFFTLTDGSAYVEQVRHVAELKVDRRGIEGAAVTVLPAAGAAGPDGWETVNEDFVVDRAFAFVLTDRYGTTLFSGTVNFV